MKTRLRLKLHTANAQTGETFCGKTLPTSSLDERCRARTAHLLGCQTCLRKTVDERNSLAYTLNQITGAGSDLRFKS